MAELCLLKVGAKVASWSIWAKKWPFWPCFLRYGLKICFAHHIQINIKGKPNLVLQKNFDLKIQKLPGKA